MTDPKRMWQLPADHHAGELLARGVAGLERPWSATAQAELGDRLEALAAGRSRWPLWLVPSAVVLAGLAAAVVFWPAAPPVPAPERVVSLSDEARFVVSPDGELDTAAPTASAPGRTVVLRQGKACAEVAHRDVARQGPLVVEAPNLTVTVVGTRFCVEAAGGLSTLTVTQGRVRAQRAGGPSVDVSAGDSLRSDDPRLARPLAPPVVLASEPALAPRLVAAPSPVAAVPPPALPRCPAASDLGTRRACYGRAAAGRGIAAQNALYGLGLLERDEAHDGVAALAAFRAYAARFPGGVFAPEASFGALGELLREARYGEALDEADRCLGLSGEGARAPVELVRAELLAGPLGRTDEAVPLLRRLSQTGPIAVRGEAAELLRKLTDRGP